MRIHQAIAVCLFTATVAGLAAPAAATSLDRQMAAGACEPFVPTNEVRYTAAGLRNAGASTIYVVCSPQGPEVPPSAGILRGDTELSIRMTNTSGFAQTLACTARPYTQVNGSYQQLAIPQTRTLPVGTSIDYAWDVDDFGGQRVGVASFTCAVGPGVTLSSVQIVYLE